MTEPLPYQDEENEQANEQWKVITLEEADWALKRCSDLEAEIDENEKVLQANLMRLRARHELLNSRARRGIEFFTWKLEEFARNNREMLLKGGKRKSRNLHHGSLSWRKSAAGLQVVDHGALLSWAMAQPEESGMLKIEGKPVLSEIQKHYRATGEVPPGTEPRAEEEKFEVRTVKTESDNE